MNVMHKEQIITDYLSSLQLKYKVDIIYFTNFELESALTFKDKFFKSFLKKINNK